MFDVGFIELVHLVALRAEALFAGTGALDAFADVAATWVRLAAAADPPTSAAVRLAGAVLIAAFFARGRLVTGRAAALLRDPAGLTPRRMAAGDVAGSVATAAGAACVVLYPNAAWTVAKASSSESWRVSTITFI